MRVIGGGGAAWDHLISEATDGTDTETLSVTNSDKRQAPRATPGPCLLADPLPLHLRHEPRQRVGLLAFELLGPLNCFTTFVGLDLHGLQLTEA